MSRRGLISDRNIQNTVLLWFHDIQLSQVLLKVQFLSQTLNLCIFMIKSHIVQPDNNTLVLHHNLEKKMSCVRSFVSHLMNNSVNVPFIYSSNKDPETLGGWILSL